MIARARVAYVGLALLTIGVGLWVHRGGIAMSPVARDVSGDALWATMICWWIGAVAPTRTLAVRSLVSLAVCAAVEFSQLLHTPILDAARGTTLGALVLGTGFDVRDLAAYTLGVAVASLSEWILMGRRTRSRR